MLPIDPYLKSADCTNNKMCDTPFALFVAPEVELVAKKISRRWR
jgi:hypothetical protein